MVQYSFLFAFIKSARSVFTFKTRAEISRKNNVIFFSFALFMMLIYNIHKVITPPKNLRHLPYVTYYNMIKSLLKGESFTDIAKHTTIPMINSSDSKGLYLVSSK
jgi:hypothetical protein